MQNLLVIMEKFLKKQEFKIRTTVTSSQIREGFSNPETVSLLSLYSFIKMFEKAGFSTNKHRLHLYKLIFFSVISCRYGSIRCQF